MNFLHVWTDEGYFGKRKTGNRRIVAGVVESQTNEVWFYVIPDAESATPEGFLWGDYCKS